MLRRKYNIEYFIICGPLAKFLLIKLILQPAQQFEFDMPALGDWSWSLLITIGLVAKFLFS
jgi:hypothetical protein